MREISLLQRLRWEQRDSYCPISRREAATGQATTALWFLHFKRAFLYGVAERELYIEIPDEDPEKKGGINVGRLQKATYGTRDAPVVWS